ncbi:MAG: RIP metalloprotease RseP [Phycisphaerae bacterium]|nr:RIP metalloprotease RseP [Phycisphaerae bacterium]
MDFLTLASFLDVLATTGYIFLVIIGFTAVIFVHELGHFLAAKYVGIRVERFAIGFGPRLFGFKRGETDYCINLLPLGGYVKMTGQEDFQLEKGAVPDPKAFNNKSVGARSLVIASGVVMNVIFAAIAFMVVFMCGKSFHASQIGNVTFDSAAYGVLRPGDVPLKMDGDDVGDQTDVMLIPALHSGKEPMNVLARHRDGTEEWLKIDPKAAKGGMLDGLKSIGVDGDYRLVLDKKLDDSEKTAYEKTMKKSLLSGDLKPGDVIVRANGQPVEYYSDLVNLAQESGGQPITLTAERKEGSRTVEARAVLGVELAGPSIPEFQLLGAHPRMTIEAVQPGYPADGKLKEGDVILRLEDVDYPLFTNGDPDDRYRSPQLMELIQRSKGKEVAIVVDRYGERKTFTIKPKTWFYKSDVKLGIGNGVYSKIAALGQVDDNSVLGKAGLPSGVTIFAVIPTTQPTTQHESAGLPATRPSSKAATRPGDLPLTWSQFYQAMRSAAGSTVQITYQGGDGDIGTITASVPPVSTGWANSIAFRPRPLLLDPLVRTYKTNSPLAAAWMGTQKTGRFILQAYVTLDRLVRGDVSVKHLSGPVGIAYGSYKTARSGLVDLLYFLAMISANLAVINFLPLPIVDGGLMAFLLYEKVRRKPVSLRVMQATQIVGFVLIISLFLWVTWQDILRLLLG